MIIFAKIRISVDYRIFILRNVHTADNFNIGLLQVVAWWFWCSGPVNADGEASLTFV